LREDKRYFYISIAKEVLSTTIVYLYSQYTQSNPRGQNKKTAELRKGFFVWTVGSVLNREVKCGTDTSEEVAHHRNHKKNLQRAVLFSEFFCFHQPFLLVISLF
jgi:hypothetical protein